MSVYSLFDHGIRPKIEEIEKLPTLPQISQQILELRDNPDADSRELAQILERDPILGSQIVRYASTPAFCSRKASNLLDATNRLGYEKALVLGLGLATGKHFSAPNGGPLGIKSFWRHSVFSALLMQSLADALPVNIERDSGMVYLCGLLHNLGYLLFAHQFPKEYETLNQMIRNNPQANMRDIERIATGATHNEIGLWLVRKWNLPAPLIITIYEHHNSAYRGDNSVYANLAYLADCSLRSYGIGDAESDEVDTDVLERLHLDKRTLTEKTVDLMASTAEIESFISLITS